MVVLNTDIQTEEKFDFDPDQIAKKVCEEVLRQEDFPGDAEISLLVTDAEEVHRLNLEFRGIDNYQGEQREICRYWFYLS